MSRTAITSSCSSNAKKRVALPPCITNLYRQASAIDPTSQSWIVPSSQDVEITLRNAKARGAFARTCMDYSVILLGSTCLNSRHVNKEKIIAELYEKGFTKIQHGAFANKPLGWVNRDITTNQAQVENVKKVARDLEVLFNSRPETREQVRSQWMEFVSYDPHTPAGNFLATYLLRECHYLIKEYIKHGPSLGLSVEEYVDLTSTLFNYCNPVECLGSIQQENVYAENNPFTKLSLASQLISPPDPDQPIPRQVICQCNNEHVCIMTEFRYRFQWEDGYLVNGIPSQVNTRIDFCETPEKDHSILYLTKKDRLELKEYIEKSSCFFGRETVGAEEESPSGSSKNIDGEGFQVVTRRKGKNKLL